MDTLLCGLVSDRPVLARHHSHLVSEQTGTSGRMTLKRWCAANLLTACATAALGAVNAKAVVLCGQAVLPSWDSTGQLSQPGAHAARAHAAPIYGSEAPQRHHGKGAEQAAGATATFDVEAPISGKTVMKKVDRHILPFFFGLALLCSIDRGARCSAGHPTTLVLHTQIQMP